MSAPVNGEMNGGHHHDDKTNDFGGSSLQRQMTVALTPEQYERLYFQPTQAKGDLAKRLGNPTLLGLLGFLVPFTTTMFCLCQFRGASILSLASVCPSWYFFGGIAMVLAGLAEFILGNTFPFVVFIIYGVHWVQAGYATDPTNATATSYGAEAAVNMAYQSGQASYSVVLLLVSFVFLIGSIRTNIPFVIIFVALVFLFGFFAAAQYQLGHHGTTADGLAYAEYLFLIAGGFGMVASIMGWYLAIITVCASTGVPCPLPVFDLSTKVFRGSNAAAAEHAGSVQQGQA